MKRFMQGYGLLLAFLVGPLFAGGMSVLAWVLFTDGPTRAPTRIEYVIPAGTAQRIAAGEAISVIPAKAIFVVGDILVLRNEDKVKHQLGPFWVPAGKTLNIPLLAASSFNYLCSIHPSGTIGIDVRPQTNLWQTLVPTLLLGVPIGGVLSLILRVVARLDVA